MLRNVFIPIILLACLLAASCGGGSVDRELSKQPEPECRVVSDVDQCGCPAVVRCQVIHGDPDFDLLGVWDWDISNGEIIEHNADWSVVWVAFAKPGMCQMSARGVDKDGKDCTSPRHKIRCARGLNAPPVPLPDGPLDNGEGFTSDADGTTRFRYHEWRWTNGRSYDAEGDTFDTQFFMYASPDVDGDGDPDGEGEPKILVSQAGDDSVRSVDIDGDLLPDVTMMPTSDRSFVVRVLFRTIKSKEDVYVWKVKAIGANGEGRKEYVGHVTLLK